MVWKTYLSAAHDSIIERFSKPTGRRLGGRTYESNEIYRPSYADFFLSLFVTDWVFWFDFFSSLFYQLLEGGCEIGGVLLSVLVQSQTEHETGSKEKDDIVILTDYWFWFLEAEIRLTSQKFGQLRIQLI